MTFSPAVNFCEENVWQLAHQPSQNPRWAVFVVGEAGSCSMWAQVSQIDCPGPVIWDYHVVLLEETPEGLVVWDDNSIEAYCLPCAQWTESNFPIEDLNVRFRVIEVAEFLDGFRSDRRHMRSETTPPPWPPITPGESNLSTYTTAQGSPPGQILDLEGWHAFTGHIQPVEAIS